MGIDVKYQEERIKALRKLAGCPEFHTFFYALECPWCGASRAEFTRYTQHTNGLWREKVRFQCGFAAEISPNYPYQPFFEQGMCTGSQAYREIMSKRRTLREELYRVLDAADVDAADRECLRNAIRHVNEMSVSDI